MKLKIWALAAAEQQRYRCCQMKSKKRQKAVSVSQLADYRFVMGPHFGTTPTPSFNAVLMVCVVFIVSSRLFHLLFRTTVLTAIWMRLVLVIHEVQ